MKKIFGTLIALVAVFALTACGSSKKEEDTTVKTQTIGVAPGPYGDMVTEVISPLLEKEGFKLKTKVFNDYIQPNKALDSGQIDGNLFQHTTYLEQFAKDNKLDLTAIGTVPTLGMGIYSKNIKNLSDIKSGDTVALANDPTNLARSLQLLVANNLVTLKGDVDETKATVDDIDDAKGLTFKTLDAAQLARSLDNVDIALVPGNFSWAADLNPEDALALEKLKENYKNVFVVQTDNKDSKFAKAVEKVLTSQDFKDAIADSKFKSFDTPKNW